MLCKDCQGCFWHNEKETDRRVSQCDDDSKVCFPVPKAHVMDMAKEMAYNRNPRSDKPQKATESDVIQALLTLSKGKRKRIPLDSVRKVLSRNGV